MNARFQIAIHILTLLENSKGEVLSSDYIAGSLNANPALVRKEISNLRNHGLIDSKEGKGGGYTLGLPADKITLGHIFRTVKKVSVLGTSKNQPNPKCPIGRQISGNINKLYEEVDQAVLTKLDGTTLATFAKGFN